MLLTTTLALLANTTTATTPLPALHTVSVAIETIEALRTTAPTIHLHDIAVGNDTVDLHLERFTITTPATRFEVGHNRTPLDRTNAHTPVLLRGTVDGSPDSFVYLAVSERGAIGLLQHAPDSPMLALAPADGRAGLQLDNLIWHTVDTGGFPPLGVPVCGLDANSIPPRTAAIGGRGVASERLLLELAVDTDYEFAALFEHDLDAATDYLIALYGAIAAIYDRDVNMDIELTYLRVWGTADDLYNEEDPLQPFAAHWNANMTDVPRDLAQLSTGRVNLPYGGVAWLSATCSDYGYSVAGYMLGSFVSATEPAFGNWDVTVAAHELGHNCGSYHTHDYGLDECASGQIRRGSIMSYCHTTTGGGANLDMRFHTVTAGAMRDHIEPAACLFNDCNANLTDDTLDIADGTSTDTNADGIPDECQDCNNNGVLDPADIAQGTSADADADGQPDECEADCNANGLPDDHDIAMGTSLDAYGNGVPDECETDCNDNGISDYTELQDDMNLDRNRNAVLDACEDCDSDGTPDLAQLDGGLNIWVLSVGDNRVTAFHPLTGVPMVQGTKAIGSQPVHLAIAPSGRILVSDTGTDSIIEVDPDTGNPIGAFISSGSGGLDHPTAIVFQQAIGDILVASTNSNEVLRYQADSGASLGTLINATSLNAPGAMCFAPNGHLLVADLDGRVQQFNAESGELVRVVVQASGATTAGMAVLADETGDMLLLSNAGDQGIAAFDFQTGEPLGRWDTGGLASGFWELLDPQTLRIGTDGKLLVATASGNTAIQSYHPTTGLFQRSFYILSQLSPATPSFDVMPAADIDCNGNMRPDACDIADGLEPDVNNNGVPDGCECAGDISGDGIIGVDDLLAIIAGWGTNDGDTNGDGIADVNDVLLVLNAWGGCA